MEYVDVYRIEKRGRGPFRYFSSEDDKRLGDSLDCSHHTPYHDAGMDREILEDINIYDYRFGAPTKESLKLWVRNPEPLATLGFKVVHYQAKKKYTHSSEIQSMFIKRHAKKIGEWSVVDFCK